MDSVKNVAQRTLELGEEDKSASLYVLVSLPLLRTSIITSSHLRNWDDNSSASPRS